MKSIWLQHVQASSLGVFKKCVRETEWNYNILYKVVDVADKRKRQVGTQKVINYNFLLKNKHIHLKFCNCSSAFFLQPLTRTNGETAFFNPLTTNYLFRLPYWFCCVIQCSSLFGLIKLQLQKANTAKIWHVLQFDKPSQWTLSLHLFVNATVELMQLKVCPGFASIQFTTWRGKSFIFSTLWNKWAHAPCVMVDVVRGSWWTEMVCLCKQQLCLEWRG